MSISKPITSNEPASAVVCREIVDELVDRVTTTQKRIWDQLEATLHQLHISNLKGPINEKALQDLNHLIDPILKDGSKADLLQLLQLVSEHNFLDSKRIANRILAVLKLTHPELENYLKGDTLIFTERAIQLLLEHHEELYRWPPGQISLCSSMDLMGQIEELDRQCEFGQFKALILYAPGEDHVAPVFIQKTSSGVKIAIIDSKGYHPTNFWPRELARILEPRKEISLYYYAMPRQRDSFSCATFGIVDLRNIVEGEISGREFIRYIEELGELKEISSVASPSTYTFQLLPPDMMKVAQSCKQLEQYQTKSEIALANAYFPIFHRKSPENPDLLLFQTLDTLDQTTKKHIYHVNRQSTLNKYAEKKYLTFLLRIVETVLGMSESQ